MGEMAEGTKPGRGDKPQPWGQTPAEGTNPNPAGWCFREQMSAEHKGRQPSVMPQRLGVCSSW